MTRPPVIEKRVSSGGVIFRRLDRTVEVALVLIKGGKTWCLPKGTVDRGESTEDTAVREVREETGLTGQICGRIGQIAYWYYIRKPAKKIHKTVHFYLMRFMSGSTEDHDHEVEEARWFRIEDAIALINYKSEREILKKAKEMIQERRLQD